MVEVYLISSLISGIIFGIIWGVVVNKVIENKGYNENWFWWGFFFGIFALIVALTKQQNTNTYNTEVTRVYDTETKTARGRQDERYKNEILCKNGWLCKKCGRAVPHHTGTCACGQSKDNN